MTAVVAVDRDPDLGFRHRQLGQIRLDRRRQCRRRLDPGGAHHGGRLRHGGGCLGHLGVERFGPAIGCFEFGELFGQRPVFFHHGLERVAVLPADLLQLMTTCLHGRESLGVLFDRVDHGTDRVGEIVEVGEDVSHPGRFVGEGSPTLESWQGLAELITNAVVVGDQFENGRSCLLMLDGVSQDLFALHEAGVFVFVFDRNGVEFFDLVAQEVDLSVTRTWITTECGESRFDLVKRRPCCFEL